jgi:hypothetical protein
MTDSYPSWLYQALRAVVKEAIGREMELPFVVTATDTNGGLMSAVWSFDQAAQTYRVEAAELPDPEDDVGLFFPITLTVVDQAGASVKATFNCSAALTQ